MGEGDKMMVLLAFRDGEHKLLDTSQRFAQAAATLTGPTLHLSLGTWDL